MYLFFDYLEVLLGAIFIGVFCDVEQKNRYCLISSIISFFVMEIMQTYDLFGNEMAYVLAITNFVIASTTCSIVISDDSTRTASSALYIIYMDICFYFNYSFIFL